jgi:O-methyltransferase
VPDADRFSAETTYDPSRQAVAFDADLRAEGRDWPAAAETMIGLKRLDNLEQCIADVSGAAFPGISSRPVSGVAAQPSSCAVLAAYGDKMRTVWVADSFEGLPPPDAEQFPVDRG